MRILVKVGFSMLVLAFFLIGLTYSVLRAEGNSVPYNREGREVTSETRKLGTGIGAIDLSGPINMTLRQGAVASLVVRGERRLLSHIETIQEGATLRIATRGMLLHHRHPLEVTLVLPAIDTVLVQGSGDSTINGFMGKRIELQLSGSGSVKFNGRYKYVNAGVRGSGEMEMNGGSSEKVDVTLNGTGELIVVGSTNELHTSQTGSGDLNARHLQANQATVSLKGSGDATVHARHLVDVSLRGSGGVRVYGSPEQRSVNRNGSGEVQFVGHE